MSNTIPGPSPVEPVFEAPRITREFPGMIDVEIRYTGSPSQRVISAKLGAFIRKYNKEHGKSYVRVSSGGSFSSSTCTMSAVYAGDE